MELEGQSDGAVEAVALRLIAGALPRFGPAEREKASGNSVPYNISLYFPLSLCNPNITPIYYIVVSS